MVFTFQPLPLWLQSSLATGVSVGRLKVAMFFFGKCSLWVDNGMSEKPIHSLATGETEQGQHGSQKKETLRSPPLLQVKSTHHGMPFCNPNNPGQQGNLVSQPELKNCKPRRQLRPGGVQK